MTAARPSRQEIIQKMNYNHAREHNFSPDRVARGDYRMFDVSVRETLASALTLPRNTAYAEHFNLQVVRQNAQTFDNFFGDRNEEWEQLNGKLAAVEWLVEPNRELAEDEFPCMDKET